VSERSDALSLLISRDRLARSALWHERDIVVAKIDVGFLARSRALQNEFERQAKLLPPPDPIPDRGEHPDAYDIRREQFMEAGLDYHFAGSLESARQDRDAAEAVNHIH
jgi:hypothetical protein